MDRILIGFALLVVLVGALYLLDWIDGLMHRWRTRRGKEKLRWK